jgi:hypothetical protein
VSNLGVLGLVIAVVAISMQPRLWIIFMMLGGGSNLLAISDIISFKIKRPICRPAAAFPKMIRVAIHGARAGLVEE